MVLSSSEVASGNGCSNWNQISKPICLNSKLQQIDSSKCPRCESTNTKFCYYNNYSRSQPRYFCKACKRHWTKGGTLRSVPVGGGRKNKHKRPKKLPKPTVSSTSTQRSSNSNTLAPQQTQIPGPDPHCFAFRQPPFVFNFQDPCQVSDTKLSGSQSSFVYNYEDLGITSSVVSQGWELGCKSSGVEQWNWDDINNFVSASDLNISWDDREDIKP